MGLGATFTLADILKYQEQQSIERYESILAAYIKAGDKFCLDARSRSTYKDYTGNLRSSIGYVIIYNAKQVAINFTYSPIGTDKETGLQTGIQLAELIGGEYPKGFVMVCVAGMEYALKVESYNKDVITEAAFDLTKNIRALLSEL